MGAVKNAAWESGVFSLRRYDREYVRNVKCCLVTIQTLALSFDKGDVWLEARLLFQKAVSTENRDSSFIT